MKITNIIGKEIKDSRGNPTLEVTVSMNYVSESFQVPSGASTGKSEAYELRDEGTLGMKKSIEIIENKIKPALIGFNVTRQSEIDSLLLAMDGTEHKTNLGGNTMIGVSIACAKLAAKLQNKEVFEYLREFIPVEYKDEAPFLYVNLINGGKHAKNNLAFQEYHIVPQTNDISEAINIIENVITELEKNITARGFQLTNGDEGGYALDTTDIYLPLEILNEAVNNSGHKTKIKYALDVAADSFYDEDGKVYKIADKNYSKEELKDIYKEICDKYDMISIEDPFYEDDFTSFADLKKELKELVVVGDDLTTTNIKRLKKASEEKSINGIIIKPNQVGTLTETINTIKFAKENNIKCIVSHRSGETMDDFITDLAVAYNTFGIKLGSPHARERKVKYNRLKQILN